MALPNYGVTFLPQGDATYRRPGQPASQGTAPVQEAVKILSLRVPRMLGASPISPMALLTGAGSQGMPAGTLQQLIQKYLPVTGPAPPMLAEGPTAGQPAPAASLQVSALPSAPSAQAGGQPAPVAQAVSGPSGGLGPSLGSSTPAPAAPITPAPSVASPAGTPQPPAVLGVAPPLPMPGPSRPMPSTPSPGPGWTVSPDGFGWWPPGYPTGPQAPPVVRPSITGAPTAAPMAGASAVPWVGSNGVPMSNYTASAPPAPHITPGALPTSPDALPPPVETPTPAGDPAGQIGAGPPQNWQEIQRLLRLLREVA